MTSEVEKICKWTELSKEYRAIILSWEYVKRKISDGAIDKDTLDDYLKVSAIFTALDFSMNDVPDYIIEMSDNSLDYNLETLGVQLKNLLEY